MFRCQNLIELTHLLISDPEISNKNIESYNVEHMDIDNKVRNSNSFHLLHVMHPVILKIKSFHRRSFVNALDNSIEFSLLSFLNFK